MCNGLVCGSTRDVLAVMAAILLAAAVSGVLIWIAETGKGRDHG